MHIQDDIQIHIIYIIFFTFLLFASQLSTDKLTSYTLHTTGPMMQELVPPVQWPNGLVQRQPDPTLQLTEPNS